jgi:hypothetical protein
LIENFEYHENCPCREKNYAERYKFNIMVLVLKKGASKKEMELISEKLRTNKGVNTKKYCSTIKLHEDPLAIQKKMRDEWE